MDQAKAAPEGRSLAPVIPDPSDMINADSKTGELDSSLSEQHVYISFALAKSSWYVLFDGHLPT